MSRVSRSWPRRQIARCGAAGSQEAGNGSAGAHERSHPRSCLPLRPERASGFLWVTQLVSGSAVCGSSPGAQPSVLSANGLCSSDPPAAGRQLQTSRDLGSQCRQLTSQSCGEVGFISPVLGQPPCEGRTQAPMSARSRPGSKMLQGQPCPLTLLILDSASALGIPKH